jgi:2,4-dienoyl-CoA reductase (NADPH2)
MFQHLLSPMRIGPLTLRNRIVLPAMELNYCMDSRVNERHLAFYAERARGGVGLIVVGGCTIDKWAGSRHMLTLQDDASIDGMRGLASAINDNGSCAGVQLYAAGAYAHSALSGQQAISASDYTSKFTREPARSMSLDEIAEVIANFAKAAKRAEAAGFKYIEISGSAGYLICQFLSERVNHRDDAYGGSLHARMRFGVEVCAAVRAAVGAHTAVGIRIAGNSFIPQGGDMLTAALFAQAISAHVDLINVTGGWHETQVPQLPAEVPRGAFVYLAHNIKASVDKPVAASNRLGNIALAEQTLARGSADLVCLGRPLIADPDLPNKLMRGETEDIAQTV